jgi:hypothetical protein
MWKWTECFGRYLGIWDRRRQKAGEFCIISFIVYEGKKQSWPFASHEHMCGSGCLPPRIYGFGTHRDSFHPEEKISSTHWIEVRTLWWWYNLLTPSGIEPQPLGLPAHSLLTVPTELSWLILVVYRLQITLLWICQFRTRDRSGTSGTEIISLHRILVCKPEGTGPLDGPKNYRMVRELHACNGRFLNNVL